jgi:serine/threonine protein kinase
MDKDRSEPEETMSLRGSGKLTQPSKVSSQIRKAQVRAALFQVSQPVQLGRFTILKCIGTGAMGEIYAAYDEQLDRKVALKLVRSGLHTSKLAEERLLREAQALARLSHPNVVQVYETGTYSGKVFIAMEFIRGQTLTAWLKTKADLPLRQRQHELLRMFLAAGRGLEAAHRTGVAHRDFKPDNVLVGHDGRVCVVDFGLARAVSEGVGGGDGSEGAERPLVRAARDDGNGSAMETGDTVDMPQRAAHSGVEESGAGLAPAVQHRPLLPLTATGTIVGTPRYMSPEQMRGEPADQRSDQFSFCVALFHALYGEWPYQGASFVELSHAVAGGAVSLPRRHAEVPASVRKALLRGLAYDPRERFPGMSELLRAIEAWPQRGRRRLWVLASVALVAAGAAGYAAIDEHGDPCVAATSEIDALWNPDRKIAIANAFAGSGRAYANSAWRSTRAVLDEYVAAWRHEATDACEATHVRKRQSAELLDKRMLCLDRGKQRLEALLTRLETSASSAIEHALGAAAALPEPTLCSDTEIMFFGLEPPPSELASAVASARAHLAEARTLHLLGRFRDALQIAEMQLRNADVLSYVPVRAEVLHQIGVAMAMHGTSEDIGRAEAILFEALDVAEGARHDELVVEIWHDLVELAGSHHSSMKQGHAWSQREQAAVRRMNDRPVDRARAFHALGVLYLRDANYAEAAAQQRRAVEILEGASHRPELLASYYHDLANAEYWRGDYDTARTLFERALVMSSEQLGAEHPRVVRLKRDFAELLTEIDDLERARNLLESALTTWTQTQGTEDLVAGRLHLSLAVLETNAGAFERAREHIRACSDTYERVLAPEHRYHAEPYMIQGVLALRQGNAHDARHAFEQALVLRRRHLADTHVLVGWTRIRLAESLSDLGSHEEALTHCEGVQQAVADGRMSETADFRALLAGIHGRALLGAGQLQRAIDVLEQAVIQFREIRGYPWERAATSWALARALSTTGGAPQERARTLAEEARAIYETRGQAGESGRDAVMEWLRR